MRKPLTWIVLLIFVVIVPFGSWYYLKQGLEYRKSLLKELLPKDSLNLNETTNLPLKGRVSLVVLNDEILKDNMLLGRIKEQYGASPYFQIVSKDNFTQSVVTIDSSAIHYILNKLGQHDFALIDTAGKVRNVYKSDEASVKKMIEHLAVVLPQPSEPDIKIKQ